MQKKTVIFLDIDGVLNNAYTKEKLWNGFDALDARLLRMFLEWLKDKPFDIVLSSTWRQGKEYRDFLNENGINWITTTGQVDGRGRGWEIQDVLNFGYIDRYVILDDLGPSEFLKHQRPFVVQTSARHGLQPKKLKRIEEILYEHHLPRPDDSKDHD